METRKATRVGPHAANGMVIWRARKRKGLTQESLAKKVGLSRIQVIKLENGMHLPKAPTRDLMEKLLGLPAGMIRCEEARTSDPFRRSGQASAGSRARRDRGGEGVKAA